MNLNFSTKTPWGTPTNFEQKILSGDKIHTIREDKSGRWYPGAGIHFCVGMRTKNYRQFMFKRCTEAQKIEISKSNKRLKKIPFLRLYRYEQKAYNNVTEVFKVKIDGKILSCSEIDVLAKNDGFDSTQDFFRWFRNGVKGTLIHWTLHRY